MTDHQPGEGFYRRRSGDIAARKVEAEHGKWLDLGLSARMLPRIVEGAKGIGRAFAEVYSPPERVIGEAIPIMPPVAHPAEVVTNDPVARWAQTQVGADAYTKYRDGSVEARGPLDNRLPSSARGFGDPKCNKFVWDALTSGGRPAGRLEGGRIPVAADWGDPHSPIGGYSPVNGKPLPGDVVSNGHHVGIFAPLPGGAPGTISAAGVSNRAAGRSPIVHNDWGFRGDEGGTVIWRANQR